MRLKLMTLMVFTWSTTVRMWGEWYEATDELLVDLGLLPELEEFK
jgi:hypothetical protein